MFFPNDGAFPVPVVKRHKRFQELTEPATLNRDLDAGFVECQSRPCCGARHFTVRMAIVVPLWPMLPWPVLQCKIKQGFSPFDMF